MGNIKLPTSDPTLAAVDAAIEASNNAKPPRSYYGTHSAGEECERAAWLDFRLASEKAFDAQTLKRFEDGHVGEDIQAARLRLVEGIELETVDPTTGEQFEFVDCNGHMKGHCDGMIKGLLQAPKTKHLWEHKQVSDKVQKELEKAIAEHGESEALKHWNPKYYAQHQIYMLQFKLKRGYMTVANAGGRKTFSVRTHFNKDDAVSLMQRSERIINTVAPDLVNRISHDPTFYKCKWCNHSDVCYGNKFPQANCRTCAHSTPVADGKWTCEKWNAEIPTMLDQLKGCEHHLFIPSMLSHEMVDTDDDNTFIEYKTPQGNFKNGFEHIQSKDLAEVGLAMLELQHLKKCSGEA